MTPLPKVYNAPLHGWDLHVHVLVGEGQLGALMINAEETPGSAGRYHKNLGRVAELLNQDVVVTADVAHVTLETPRASFVVELSLKPPPGAPGADANFELAKQNYVEQGFFAPDKVARLGMRIRVR